MKKKRKNKEKKEDRIKREKKVLLRLYIAFVLWWLILGSIAFFINSNAKPDSIAKLATEMMLTFTVLILAVSTFNFIKNIKNPK